MANTEFFDEVITVTALIDQNGQTTPKSLSWQGNGYILTAIGRQWEEEDGRHILVEAGNGDRFEILLSRKDLVWRLKRAWREELVA